MEVISWGESGHRLPHLWGAIRDGYELWWSKLENWISNFVCGVNANKKHHYDHLVDICNIAAIMLKVYEVKVPAEGVSSELINYTWTKWKMFKIAFWSIEPAKHVTYHYLQSRYPHHMTYRAQSLVQAYKVVPPTSSLATLQRSSPCKFWFLKNQVNSISIMISQFILYIINNESKLNFLSCHFATILPL